MRALSAGRQAVLAGLAALLITGAWVAPASGSRPADTTPGTLVGEGGDGLTPIMSKLLHDDGPNLLPDFGSYTNVDIDHAIADFVGTAPNTFAADFVVSERALTSAEAATAKTDGRGFAYVPIAASPVALMTWVPKGTWTGPTISSNDLCQHIPLSLANLDTLYGGPANWGDAGLSCTASPATAADPLSVAPWGNLDPSMENEALMTLLDSTTASQTAFAAGLAAAEAGGASSTPSPTPTETWPFSKTAITGGDGVTLGKILQLDSRTGAPSNSSLLQALGAIMPVENDWTGDPETVVWNLPTAAVFNAAGQNVVPTSASASAALGDATLASTTDPTTNNLLTFTANPNDATAYNNDLMLPEYLVVPTNGLPADKATALAQFIRFAVGKTGQADITALGDAPATTAMTTADLAVAQQLDAEAAADPTTTTTTSTAAGAGSTTTTTAAAGTSAASTGAGSGAGGTGNSGSGSLASTGGDPMPLLALGAGFVVCGEAARRLLKRRREKERARA